MPPPKRYRSLRNQILKEHGVTFTGDYTVTLKRSTEVPELTPLMEMLQLRHKQPIDILLSGGTNKQIAERLRIDKSLVSRWKRRRRIARGLDAD